MPDLEDALAAAMRLAEQAPPPMVEQVTVVSANPLRIATAGGAQVSARNGLGRPPTVGLALAWHHGRAGWVVTNMIGA